jgi:phosphoglycolate phosphatase
MDLLIFDLDGTLIDSKRDLAEAVNATRANLGLAPLDLATIAKYVGNGAPVLIRRALGPGYSEEQVEEALLYFLDYYRDHSLDYTRLYAGVRDALDALRSRGIAMAVLTNKPVRVSKAILEGLGVAGHFFKCYGGNSFEQKKPHRVGVDALRQEAGGVAPERTMMVGDSSVDVQTAINAGVKSCGVTYGFQPETLSDPKPDLLVDRMEQLVQWVASNSQPCS